MSADGQNRTSHYEQVAEQWRQRFLTWDQEEIIRKLHIADYDETSIRLSYFGILHAVDRRTGRISCPDRPDYEPVFNEVMAIYNFFYYAEENAENSGEWVHFRDVKDAGVFEDAFERQVLKPFAEAFAGKPERFREAGARLGFTPLSYGDAGFLVPAFEKVPLQVIFWDGDEEFPASVNLLFDRNIIRFIHPEDVVLLGMECMRYFMEEENQLPDGL